MRNLPLIPTITYILLCLSAHTKCFKHRIVGGHRCPIEQHPYMVSIRNSVTYEHFCGGSLVSSLWVLTAAHCVFNIYVPGMFSVEMGFNETSSLLLKKHKLSPNFWRRQWALVVNYYIHEDYDYMEFHNDIALLKLGSPINPGPGVDFVKLPEPLTEKKLLTRCRRAVIIGWGDQHEKGIHGRPIIIPVPRHDAFLQCAVLPLISLKECQRRAPHAVYDTIVCAYKEHMDSCQGDSGGPLVCHGVQYGIVSSGYGCAHKWYPGLYTRVDKYLDFINYTIMNEAAGLGGGFWVVWMLLLVFGLGGVV